MPGSCARSAPRHQGPAEQIVDLFFSFGSPPVACPCPPSVLPKDVPTCSQVSIRRLWINFSFAVVGLARICLRAMTVCARFPPCWRKGTHYLFPIPRGIWHSSNQNKPHSRCKQSAKRLFSSENPIFPCKDRLPCPPFLSRVRDDKQRMLILMQILEGYSKICFSGCSHYSPFRKMYQEVLLCKKQNHRFHQILCFPPALCLYFLTGVYSAKNEGDAKNQPFW